MYCKKCGEQLSNGEVFCPNCGTQNVSTEEPVYAQPVDNSQRENIFANLSNTFGKISLWLCWTFFVPIILTEAGIALAILGMIFKNKFPKNSELAKPALIKNIVALVISLVLFFVVYYVAIAISVYLSAR